MCCAFSSQRIKIRLKSNVKRAFLSVLRMLAEVR
jgi:hypothetical protein